MDNESKIIDVIVNIFYDKTSKDIIKVIAAQDQVNQKKSKRKV